MTGYLRSFRLLFPLWQETAGKLAGNNHKKEMHMEKEPLFIELTGRKCEPGKTFFTVFTGGVLHNRRGYNVAMMDCDPLQYSIGPTEHAHLMTNLM